MSVRRRKINLNKAKKFAKKFGEKPEEYKMIRPMKRSGPKRNITNDDLQPDEYDFSWMGQGTRPRRKGIEMVSEQPAYTRNHQPTPKSSSFKSRNAKK